MSQSDKTRQKLVDSMRKTKSGATEEQESPAAEEQKKPESPAPKKSTGTGSKPAAKRSEKKTVSEKTTDGFQSVRRRVWPD